MAISIKKRMVRFMAKKELFFFGMKQFVTALGAFKVDRGKTDITAIKTAISVLKSGGILGIFPEGTRNDNDADMQAKAGIAMLCNRTKSTVVPGRIFQKKRFCWFKKITVVIGESIPYETLNFGDGKSEDIQRVADEIFEIIKGISKPVKSKNKTAKG